MDFRRKRLIVKLIVAAGILVILGVTVWSFLTPQRGPDRGLGGRNAPSRLAFGKNISFVEYQEERKVYSLRVGEFYLDRARLGPFAIGPLNVANFRDVQVDFYLEGPEAKVTARKKGNNASERDEIDFEKLITGMRKSLPSQVKRIAGVQLKDISIRFWRNGERVFWISSDTASVDRNAGDLIFTGRAVMDAGEKGRLKSHRIRWDRKTRLFRVTDPFVLTMGEEKKEGRELETDYLFKRVNYSLSRK